MPPQGKIAKSETTRCGDRELVISNIAFPPGEFDAGLDVLAELDVRAVELAPYNIFGRWDVAGREIDLLRERLDARGIRCRAMQGIVYKAGAAHLFASTAQRKLLSEHLGRVAQMAGRLGAAACVFGAPQLRDPGEIGPQQAHAVAVAFLRELGPVFASEGTVLSFEPNARRYSCRFVTTTSEAVDLVRSAEAPGIAVQIDTGTAFLEEESPAAVASAIPYAVHAHISEPDLLPVGSVNSDHRPYSEALRKGGYKGALSIEMKQVDDWKDALRRAVAFARETYWP
ncbi:sugar phosphate isomerase/epimerase family protein [Bradyrhizobium guangzhouense]|uniref:sugar phosphate isomerase/epimerase family protein n=1 Tax=Bradyrhizobium guangzhouense TaxID=1325095 RepID=UPI0013E8CAD3|nr:sugar phosphate isomerase/epimerase family protein [Bradyrhizobium guangzhouense]